MHIGQRDIAWIRISKAAIDKGFTLKHLGVVQQFLDKELPVPLRFVMAGLHRVTGFHALTG